MWITVDQIINFHGLKPKNLNLDKDDYNGLDGIVSDWILQCQSLIETYTNRTYTDDNVPGAVQNVLIDFDSGRVRQSVGYRRNYQKLLVLQQFAVFSKSHLRFLHIYRIFTIYYSRQIFSTPTN